MYVCFKPIRSFLELEGSFTEGSVQTTWNHQKGALEYSGYSPEIFHSYDQKEKVNYFFGHNLEYLDTVKQH